MKISKCKKTFTGPDGPILGPSAFNPFLHVKYLVQLIGNSLLKVFLPSEDVHDNISNYNLLTCVCILCMSCTSKATLDFSYKNPSKNYFWQLDE